MSYLTEPMTEKQSKYLAHLCEQAGHAFDPDLSKEEARHVISELRDKRTYRTRTEVRKVICPKCGAGVGSYCRAESGAVRTSNHFERVSAAVSKGPHIGGSN